MLNAKVIGVGAAGNKAAINLIERGVVESNKVLLLNTTLKDIPEKYQELSIEFGNTRGCGKERSAAKQFILQSLKKGQVNIQKFLDPNDKIVIIVTSVEGGTGCGASSILAEYIDTLGLNVHMFALCGFEDDVRGMKNFVDWFDELLHQYQNITNMTDRRINRLCILLNRQIDKLKKLIENGSN